MIKSYAKAAAAVILVLAGVLIISIYDSEEFAEPIIQYSEVETLIPLDSIWEETEEQISEQTQSQTDIIPSMWEEQITNAVIEETVIQTTCSENVVNNADKGSLININTATVEELKELNGIGDVIAARIVEYAQTIGFNSIEEIKNVKGIGDKKYENIKDKITV
ncbi:MAG: ComEA family DNA-binding protein [Oscillospiraceae bacterium]